MLGNFLKCGDCTFVAFDTYDTACAERKQRARKPTWTRSDLHHRDIFKRFSRSRYARGQIEVEEEILAERFFRLEIMPADDLAQRR